MDYILTAVQAARIVGVSSATIRRKAKEGLLPYRVKGRTAVRRRWYFRRADIERLRREYSAGFVVTAS